MSSSSNSTRRQILDRAALVAAHLTESLEYTGYSAESLDTIYSILVDSLVRVTEEEGETHLQDLLREIDEIDSIEPDDESHTYN